MNWMDKLLADSFNGISLSDFPFIGLVLFGSALGAWTIVVVCFRTSSVSKVQTVLIAISVTAIVLAARQSVQLAALGVGVLYFLKDRVDTIEPVNRQGLFLSCAYAFVCGTGYLVIAFFLLLLIIVIKSISRGRNTLNE
jgi:hypothetical protein